MPDRPLWQEILGRAAAAMLARRRARLRRGAGPQPAMAMMMTGGPGGQRPGIDPGAYPGGIVVHLTVHGEVMQTTHVRTANRELAGVLDAEAACRLAELHGECVASAYDGDTGQWMQSWTLRG